jgi:hypothetical protein
VYRPPNGNFESFKRIMNEILENIDRENKQCYLMGDFNMWQAGSPKQVMNLKCTFSQGIVIVMTTFRIVHRDINV